MKTKEETLIPQKKDEASRREFLIKAGKMALYVPPAMMVLMHPSRNSFACSWQPTQCGGKPPKFGGKPPYFGGKPPYFGGKPPYFGGKPPYFGGKPPYFGKK